MSATIKKKEIWMVAAVAILIESLLIFTLSHQHASHNPSILLLFHLPGIVLVELMHIPDSESLFDLSITGAVQLFILFLVGWVILKQIYGRSDA